MEENEYEQSEPYQALNRNMDTNTSPSCRNQNLSLERSRSQCNEEAMTENYQFNSEACNSRML